MVEYSMTLDSLFGALADGTRRDMLSRLTRTSLTVGELAHDYDLTFAAVSKHLKVLEKAKLVIKRRRGKQQVVSLAPQALVDVDRYLEQYRRLWESRLDSLEQYLKETKEEQNGKRT